MSLQTKEINELERDILNIRSLDFKLKYGIEGIKEALITTISGYAGSHVHLNSEKFYLYRARVNRDKNGPVDFFHHTNELWAPSDVNLIRKGRCNDDKECILYCSSHPITCYAELGLKRNDYLTTIVFKAKEDILIGPVTFVGLDELIKYDNQLSNYLSQLRSSFQQDPLSLKKQRIDILIAEDFRTKVENTEPHGYNLTIAWRQLYFEFNKAVCLVYPSVKSLMKTSNWAFDPEYVRKNFTPFEAQRAKVEWISEDGLKMAISTEDFADLEEYGNITWVKKEKIMEHLTHERVAPNPFKLIERPYRSS